MCPRNGGLTRGRRKSEPRIRRCRVGRLPFIRINVHFCRSDIPRSDLLHRRMAVSSYKSALRVNNSRGQGLARTARERLSFVGIALRGMRRPPPQICVLPAFGARHAMVRPEHASVCPW
jgi:hypothetical protein